MLALQYEVHQLFTEIASSTLVANRILATHLKMVQNNHGDVCGICLKWRDNIAGIDVFRAEMNRKVLLVSFSICDDCIEIVNMDPEGAFNVLKENILSIIGGGNE